MGCPVVGDAGDESLGGLAKDGVVGLGFLGWARPFALRAQYRAGLKRTGRQAVGVSDTGDSLIASGRHPATGTRDQVMVVGAGQVGRFRSSQVVSSRVNYAPFSLAYCA